ncbi:hypothetical protein M9Y10_038292 [Tritrichomonas musculus]|uniref:Uncharacterized protein n=1 Tax=Tritrichomonas musculus TaxID=1915356 RepID=A0ABR2K836_9EUKA
MNAGNKLIIGRSNLKSDNEASEKRKIHHSSLKSISRTFLFLTLFYFSLIERISIHSNVTEIDKEAFSYCFNLSGVGISSDSQLGIINNCTYSESSIRKFAVSPHLTKTYLLIYKTNIYIHLYITNIFTNAFYSCPMLNCTDIPHDS